MTNKNVLVGLIAILVIAVGGYFFPKGVAGVLGGMPFLEVQYFQKGLAIDARGTVVKKALTGTCTLIGANASVVASSTSLFDCAVTGVVSGDQVFVALNSTAKEAFGSFSVSTAQASTTAGYITIGLTNGTGAAMAPSAAGTFGSSTAYWILRD